MTKSVFIQTGKGYLVNPITPQFDHLLTKTFSQLIQEGVYEKG